LSHVSAVAYGFLSLNRSTYIPTHHTKYNGGTPVHFSQQCDEVAVGNNVVELLRDPLSWTVCVWSFMNCRECSFFLPWMHHCSIHPEGDWMCNSWGFLCQNDSR